MTTTNSLLQTGSPTGGGGVFGSTAFLPISGTISTSAFLTEAAIAAAAGTALTLANFGVLVITGAAATQTLRSRIAGANGNQVISITGSGTGWFTDSTHSDSVTATQKIDSSWNTASGGATGSIIQFAAQATSPLVVWQTQGNSAVSFSTSVKNCYPFGSNDGVVGTESSMQGKVRAAGTWKSAQVGISGAVTGTITIKSRKNTADGNQVISSVNPGANATAQDTTHSDSVVSGDLLDFAASCSAASGSWLWLYSEFAGTISAHDIGNFASASSGNGNTFAASTSYYFPLSGPLTAQSTESKTQATLPYALTASKLRSLIHTNTLATITIKSRKGGADGNQTISVASGTTGEVEDTTHSDSYASTNTINITGVTGTLTTLRIDNIRMLLDDGSVSAAVAYTLTAVQGSYSVTGQAAGLSAGPRITAVQGSYSITGQTTALKSARFMTSVKGTYSLSGQAAALSAGPRITAVQGVYSLTGEVAGLMKHLSFAAVRGLYTLTGEDINHISDLSVFANVGSYHISGHAVTKDHARTVKAHVGKYRVHKEKVVLRGPTSSVTIWPVDTGDYILDGQDAIFGQERYRLTFSGFINPDYLDWPGTDGADYQSYLHTNYVMPSDAMAWFQVPYLYVFVAETDTDTDKSLLLNVVRNWAETGNVPQIGSPIQVYRHRDGYLLSVSKNRINGRGRVMRLQYKSETGKAFNLRGWAMWVEQNTKT